MDKLSIVEKAKRYDEAIKKLRSLHDNYDTVSTLIDVKEELEDIFPELAESEEEKIKQELIEYHKIQAFLDGKPNNKHVKFVAWLEKQGEKKPAEWSEEDEMILSDIIKDLVHPWNEYIPYRIEDEIKWLKNKLKTLKDRVQPQQKQEWSEEDEKMLGYAIKSVHKMYVGKANNSVSALYCKVANWLKFLHPQKQWKPSDEQMEAMQKALVDLCGKDEHNIITGLYYDLKKLKA